MPKFCFSSKFPAEKHYHESFCISREIFDYREDEEIVFWVGLANLQYLYYRKVQAQLEKLNISTNFNGKRSFYILSYFD
jgi:hypothetical protein